MEIFKKILNGIFSIIIAILKWLFTFVKDLVIDAWDNKEEHMENYEKDLAKAIKSQDTASLVKRADNLNDKEESLTMGQEKLLNIIENELDKR